VVETLRCLAAHVLAFALCCSAWYVCRVGPSCMYSVLLTSSWLCGVASLMVNMVVSHISVIHVHTSADADVGSAHAGVGARCAAPCCAACAACAARAVLFTQEPMHASLHSVKANHHGLQTMQSEP
jgi:hypothetical protein